MPFARLDHSRHFGDAATLTKHPATQDILVCISMTSDWVLIHAFDTHPTKLKIDADGKRLILFGILNEANLPGLASRHGGVVRFLRVGHVSGAEMFRRELMQWMQAPHLITCRSSTWLFELFLNDDLYQRCHDGHGNFNAGWFEGSGMLFTRASTIHGCDVPHFEPAIKRRRTTGWVGHLISLEISSDWVLHHAFEKRLMVNSASQGVNIFGMVNKELPGLDALNDVLLMEQVRV